MQGPHNLPGNSVSQGEQQQQQQMAMHSQIMYQHGLLMQQYGMAPPFVPFQNFGSAIPSGQVLLF